MCTLIEMKVSAFLFSRNFVVRVEMEKKIVHYISIITMHWVGTIVFKGFYYFLFISLDSGPTIVIWNSHECSKKYLWNCVYLVTVDFTHVMQRHFFIVWSFFDRYRLFSHVSFFDKIRWRLYLLTGLSRFNSFACYSFKSIRQFSLKLKCDPLKIVWSIVSFISLE